MAVKGVVPLPVLQAGQLDVINAVVLAGGVEFDLGAEPGSQKCLCLVILQCFQNKSFASYFSSATVTPSWPSFHWPRRNDFTLLSLDSASLTALRRAPVPLPWTMRTRSTPR